MFFVNTITTTNVDIILYLTTKIFCRFNVLFRDKWSGYLHEGIELDPNWLVPGSNNIWKVARYDIESSSQLIHLTFTPFMTTLASISIFFSICTPVV